MIGLRVLLWQSDGLEEKALLPQYLVHGNNGPTGQTDFFVDSLLVGRYWWRLACGPHASSTPSCPLPCSPAPRWISLGVLARARAAVLDIFPVLVILGLKFRDTVLIPGKPTVSLGVTYVVEYIYRCDDGRILPTRCAIIDAGLGDTWSPRRGCRTPPAAARSTRSALAGGSRQASAAAPDGFHRSRTRPRSASTPCDDASPPRYVLDTHPCLLHPCLVESWLQCRRQP